MPWRGASESRTFRGITVLKTWFVKVRPDLVRDLVREVVRRVHGEDDPVHLEARVRAGAHELDRLQHVGEPLERVVLALERDDDALRRDEPVQREEPERGRAVDDDVLVLARDRVDGRA